MKAFCCVVFFLFTLSSLYSQRNYAGIKIINAGSERASYRIGNQELKDSWTLDPTIGLQTLTLSVYYEYERLSFYTDEDSIQLDVYPGIDYRFGIAYKKKDTSIILVKGSRPNYTILPFQEGQHGKRYELHYERGDTNSYLRALREMYQLDTLIRDATTDMQRALGVLHWVHRQWAHDGGNEPIKNDAVSILEDAKLGKKFRCVEYSIVTTACLNAIGLPARTVALRTKEVEITPSGAGHVVSEVYLNDLKKWVLVDGQWDAMPVLNDSMPLNAVQFQRAIVYDKDRIVLKSLSCTNKKQYFNWIFPYLYYFSFAFDNRQYPGNAEPMNRRPQLMLVPKHAKKPTIFQLTIPIENCSYTSDPGDVYWPPGK